MRVKLLLISLLVGVNAFCADRLSDVFQILPEPQSIEVFEGEGFMYNELRFVSAAPGTPVPVLGTLTDGLPRSERSGKGLFLQLAESDVPESEEGYVLIVDEGGVTVTARAEAGLFYGCQTLEQLLEDSRDFGQEIPPMKITDYPAIGYRAVHLDTKHHLDRMEYYYRMVDKLARYKVNAIIWELEDKLRYTRRPEIGSGNAISKQEMQTLCRYAKDRNVEISPLVQGLGHAGYILKHHWELRENPMSDWEFCPADPRTYELQFDLYLDALEAMPYGRYLHVGGDEITAIGIDERCKATGKTAFELQMDWLQQVCKFATDHGRIPIFWDDMPLKYAGVWNLAMSDLTEEEVNKAWDDGSPHLETVWRGYIALGEFGWNPTARSVEAFKKADALRNRYTLQIYEQINEMQIYPVRLILALETYDNARSAGDREAALRQVADLCDYFPTLRANLEAVYSQTRFMEQPEGFISDLNHHNHIASKTNDSSWIFYYEIPMVSKIRQWLKALQ